MLGVDAAPTLVATTSRADPERLAALIRAGVEVEVVDAASSAVDLRELMTLLGARGVISVLIEGGPSLLGSAFDQGIVDKVVAMIAPRIIGGASAPGAVGGVGAATLAAAPLLRDVAVEHAGPDLLISGYCVR